MASLISSSSTDQAWRQERYHRFYEVVDRVVEQLLSLPNEDGSVKRKLKGDRLKKLKYSVETLIRDAVAVVLQRKRKGEAIIHLGQYAYGSGRDDAMLTYDIHVKRAYHGMLRLGFLEQTKNGIFDRTGRKDGTSASRLTRYVATDALIDLFTEEEQRSFPLIVPPRQIELIRVQVKQEVNGVERRIMLSFPETDETRSMRDNLSIINGVLERSWYDLEISDDQLDALQAQMVGKVGDERTLDMSRRTLYRVFNDPALKTGGRFYGGWWQNIPKAYRSKLLVNGKRMVEFDYSNMHPTILYAWAGLERPQDCYSGILRPITISAGMTDGAIRSLAKVAFNAMLNAPSELRNAPEGINPKRLGLRWQDIAEQIRTFHAPIAAYFFTGVGRRLQRIDSDIAERVMLAFAKTNTPILPVHDSFLVHEGHTSKLIAAMEEAFQATVNVAPKLDMKKFKDSLGDVRHTEDDVETTQDLDMLLQYLNETGYERRLDTFLASRSGQAAKGKYGENPRKELAG